MKRRDLKRIQKVSTFIVYTLMLLFIGSYFDLELPINVLLEKLQSKLLISVVFGAFLVFFGEWALRKGGITDKDIEE